MFLKNKVLFQIATLFQDWQDLAALDSILTARKEELEQIVSTIRYM